MDKSLKNRNKNQVRQAFLPFLILLFMFTFLSDSFLPKYVSDSNIELIEQMENSEESNKQAEINVIDKVDDYFHSQIGVKALKMHAQQKSLKIYYYLQLWQNTHLDILTPPPISII